MRRLATIDLGTNTVRLLVAEAQGQQWRWLLERQRVTRLGQGQAAAGRLCEVPMARTLEVMAEFVAAAEGLGAAPIRIVATSAVRDAPNGGDFAERVRAVTRHAVEILSGEQEARLTLLAVRRSLPWIPEPFVLVDIGGGSTELVLCREGGAAAAVSLSLGVVPLTEEFMDAGAVDGRRLGQMRRAIVDRLAHEVPAAIAAAGALALVGTAGTVTALAALDLGLPAYDADRVHGHRLTRPAVERLLARLGGLTLEERSRLPCLEPGRADVLIAGIAICLAAMDRLGSDSLVVSDRGLREGILCEMLEP
ncbi:MAG: Ppx/GppA family phosphatase [Candidatus Rokubacteria bacterium]|nr:Ppx/GppA family phosphatase [Candidatus Rokubacteria bacterium]